MELTKTMGYELGCKSGAELLHKTLSGHHGEDLAMAIPADFALMLNEAQFPPPSMKQAIGLARMVGYITELSSVVAGLSALGFTIESRQQPDGEFNFTLGIGKPVMPRQEDREQPTDKPAEPAHQDLLTAAEWAAMGSGAA